MFDLKQIRQDIKTKRLKLSPQQRLLSCQQVVKQLQAQVIFQESQHIAFYVAVNGELDPQPLLEAAWEQQKTCYLPILHPQQPSSLQFVIYQPGDRLIKNRYGILEPELTNAVLAQTLDLVLMPLVAFDAEGNRVGMGCGYYDRVFAFKQKNKSKPCLIGLAYEFQKIEQLFPQAWDVPMNMVVTEKTIYKPVK